MDYQDPKFLPVELDMDFASGQGSRKVGKTGKTFSFRVWQSNYRNVAFKVEPPLSKLTASNTKKRAPYYARPNREVLQLNPGNQFHPFIPFNLNTSCRQT
jgi:hypothetical protein